ncbi:hypothetical protein H5T88_03190 [bacterium]|nr:hypothetical protein [bacterium]
MFLKRVFLGIAIILLSFALAENGRDTGHLSPLSSSSNLPKGEYQLVKVWNVEKDLLHQGGSLVEDPEAKKGKAWEVNSLNCQPGIVIYGPYIELQSGDFVAFFRLKLLQDVDDEVVSIYVYNNLTKSLLNIKTIYSSDLIINRYTWVFLPFRYQEGKIELRVGWLGTASLRIDEIELYKVEGGNAEDFVRKFPPQPVPSGEPGNLISPLPKHPLRFLFPRSSSPNEVLYVYDLTKAPSDLRLATITLQGIINREEPQIYLLLLPTDEFWLEWMEKRGFVKRVEEIKEISQLLDKFRHKIKGVIIYDPRLPATKNIATMLASLKTAIVVSPRLAKELGLPVVEDLRGRWKRSFEAYRWAFDNLWEKMNHKVLACLYPDNYWLRDYLVANKIFTFWLPGQIDGAEPYSNLSEEVHFVEELLSKAPPNVPILGAPWAGIGTPLAGFPGVGWGDVKGFAFFSEFAKFGIGSIECTNLTVHSGIQIENLSPPPSPPPPALDTSKVYISFIISDGDNLPVLSVSNFPQLWQDKRRGKFPIGWTIDLAAPMLIPSIVDYYFSTATPMDSFVAACGLGVGVPDNYGARYKERDKVFNEYLDLTAKLMERMGIRTIWLAIANELRLINRYAEHIHHLSAIFPDYGKKLYDYSDITYITSKNVPVFHAATNWKENLSREQQIANIVSQVRSITPSQRPAFLNVFICNWFFDISMLDEIVQLLGDDYVVVRPDHLGQLYKKYAEMEKLFIRVPSILVGIQGQPMVFAFSIQNVCDERLNGIIKVEGFKNIKISIAKFNLLPSQSADIMVYGVPIRTEGKIIFGTKTFKKIVKINLKLTESKEIVNPLELQPDIIMKFIKHLEAEDLLHPAGKMQEDPLASGGKVWEVRSGDTVNTHIVYGPYMPLEKGLYIALFRLKRLSEGEGRVVSIDTCVGGGKPVTSSQDIWSNELPIGEFKCFALCFEHPGGPIETRVFWEGKIPIAIDCIDIFQVISKKEQDG